MVKKSAAVEFLDREVGVDKKHLGDVANHAERPSEKLSSSWCPTRSITGSL